MLFKPLTLAEIQQIVVLQTDELRRRLVERGIGLEIEEEAIELIARRGFDPVYGARPLKRAIQHQIENPLAQRILAGDFASGDTIQIDVEDGRFSFG